MIHTLSIKDADNNKLSMLNTHCISPYMNPAHFLSPPRSWLEALLREEISWNFLRLRYKNLLRNRFLDQPRHFFELLQDSESYRPVYLTCHCLTDHCHREVAKEFLEMLREQAPYQEWSADNLSPFVLPLGDSPLGELPHLSVAARR